MADLMPDPYEIIGVRRDASLDEIRIAYRRSAQVLHPDRFATSSDGVRSEAARRMLQLNSAMEAIEIERADEASGTGTLGSVSFGRGASAATASAPAAAPQRTAPASPPLAPHGTNGSNGTPPHAPSETPAAPTPPRVELARPATPATPTEDADASAANPQAPAAGPTPTRSPGRDLEAYVAPPATEQDEVAEPAPRPEARRAAPPPAPEPQPEHRSYSLHFDTAFSFEDDDDYEDELPPVRRRSRRASGGRSVLPAVIAGVVIVVALAVIGAYFAFGRGGGTGEATFAKASAPFSFGYPKDFHQRRLDGGVALNKPTYQVGFGLDSSNYLLASTYKLGFTVEDDGSATGPKGQQLTPDQINHDIDVTIAKLAGQAGFTQKGVESGSLGSLRARIYDYAKADGSLSSTFVVALKGQTEYYVTCQSTPRGEKRIAKACERLLSSFTRA
jgi:hypothetical protein